MSSGLGHPSETGSPVSDMACPEGRRRLCEQHLLMGLRDRNTLEHHN